jgi:hypothetical protein
MKHSCNTSLKKSPFIFLAVCTFFFLSGCNSSGRTSALDIEKRYSKEAINYFFELAFFDNTQPKTIRSLAKWEKDIYLFLGGDTMPGDRSRVINAIAQMNSVGLPVKIRLSDASNKSNLFLHFKPVKKGSISEDTAGTSAVTSVDGVIETVRIDIANDSVTRSNFDLKRKAVILHELMHSMGLPGHSNTYSVAVLRANLTTELTDIDRQVLMLLYERSLSPDYAGAEFEKDFSRSLYHINAKEKLTDHIKAQKINKATLQKIELSGLHQPKDKTMEPKVVKFTNPINVYAKGDVYPGFITSINDAAQELHSATKGIDMKYPGKAKETSDDGIYFNFQHIPALKNAIAVSISTTTYWDLRFQSISKTEIQIRFRDQKDMPLAIANALFQAICRSTPSGYFIVKSERLCLKPEFREVLRLYYDPALSSGLSKTDLEDVFEQLP